MSDLTSRLRDMAMRLTTSQISSVMYESADALDIAIRYMKAVASLGEDSGYNRLTYFEAPISKMPTDEMANEALARWQELNNAGQALTSAIGLDVLPSPLYSKDNTKEGLKYNP